MQPKLESLQILVLK
jgi:hypothetical protein